MQNIFLLLLLSASTFSQVSDLKFAKHLYQKGFYKEALLELKLQQQFRTEKNDSLTFYSGLCLIEQELKDSAVNVWKNLNPTSAFYPYSQSYSALYLAETGRNAEWLRSTDLYKEKWNKYSGTMKRMDRKKPFVGGLLSALIPGTGKIYAGKPRQFLSTLLPIAILGIQAWEGYNHSGFKSGRFWVYGSVFTLFYLGNIYGSAIAVRVAKKEQYDLVQHQVMVDLRLALHDLYGRPWK